MMYPCVGTFSTSFCEGQVPYKNKERQKKYFKSYNQARKEAQRAYNKKHYVEHEAKKAEYQRTYYIKHKTKIHARARARLRREPEVVRAINFRWRRKNANTLMLYATRARAKRRGIEFAIDLEDITIPDICPVLNIPIKQSIGFGQSNSPSIDRIDCKKGYIKGNVCIISWRANTLKRDASVKELEQIAAYMKAHGL